MKKLLKFNEDAYNKYVRTIQRTEKVLKNASQELNKHGVEATPKLLADGKVYKRALEHYRKKYESSALSKDISFEKYLEFTETDLSPLKLVQETIQGQLAIVFRFYPDQHEFFSFFEQRREPEIHLKAGKKVELPITRLFKWVGEDKIEVTLDRKYFELYATNELQINKIRAIDNLISACKEMDVKYELVRKAAGRWVKDLSYDLSYYEINHFEVLKGIN